LESRLVWEYDATGKKLTQSTFDGNKKLTEKIVFAYSPDGRISEEDKYDAPGKLIAKTTYDYDKIGNWVKKTVSKAMKEFGTSMLKPSEEDDRVIDYFE
jgi:antitoxin component YwqK of YwqJK toxin-antitoxin module